MEPYNWTIFFACLLLYSFVGWAAEMAYYTIKHHRFINSGFLNVPFALPYGIAAVLLMVSLPTLRHNVPLQFILTFVVLGTVMTLAEQFIKRISRQDSLEREHRQLFYNGKNIGFVLLLAAIYLIFYLTVHPIAMALLLFIPDTVLTVVVSVVMVLVIVDFFGVIYTIRTRKVLETGAALQKRTVQLRERATAAVWKRLQNEYPGIQEPQDLNKPKYVFAKGLCFDKLVWVFLVSSFLGALIEMVYCHHIDGFWMNRSSLLYGTFSVVWGFGAVILTVTLQRLRDRNVLLLFAAGFLIGGSYEYLCSVMSEIVFGTVFWDYSNMPLNIGGRTNVPYCAAWGLLGVIWMKGIYPLMDQYIEKIPTLLGECITWAIVAVMLCNGLLTASAMARYTDRQTAPEAQNVIEEFLDTNYDNTWMEQRWPNMKVA